VLAFDTKPAPQNLSTIEILFSAGPIRGRAAATPYKWTARRCASNYEVRFAMILPDFLKPCLDVVFCGSAAGNASASRGHYYAGPGNKFWTVLHTAGLTSERLRPDSDRRVTEFGIGLTDLVKLHSGNDVALRASMYDVPDFVRKIEVCAPRFLAFNGKRSAAAFLGLRRMSFAV
jgi:double-stranded uracil-DNA glycosylase